MNISSKEIAKQMVFLDRELLDLGDSYCETVSYLCELAEVPYQEFEDDDCEKALAAYEKLAKEKPYEMVSLMVHLFDKRDNRIDDIYRKMQYYEEVDKNTHPTIIACKTLLEYTENLLAGGFCDSEFVENVKSNFRLIFESDLESIRIAHCIGHDYFKYLNPEYFGIVTNGCFRVGDVIEPDEREKEPFKDYLYKAHAEFNASGLNNAGYALFFKRGQVDIYSFNRFRDFYNFDYEKTNCSLSLDGEITEISMKIAEKINAFAKQYAENQKLL